MVLVAACASGESDRDAADRAADTTSTTAVATVAATIEAGPVGGRVVVWTAQHDVVALSVDAQAIGDGGDPVEVPTEQLATDVEVPPALSPDGTQLLLVRPSGLALLDVATGQESTLALVDEGAAAVAAADCLSWAPDGARFTVRSVTGALYVATPGGDARLVDAPKEARYDAVSIGGRVVAGIPGGRTHRSTVSCGRWLDEARLVLQRVAQMPESVSTDPADPGAPVPLDTTSVGVIEGDGIRLVDFGDRWYLRAACADRWIVTDAPDGTDPAGAGTDPSATDGPDAVGRVVVDDTADLTAPGREAGGDLLTAGDVIDREALALRPAGCELLAHDAAAGSFDVVGDTGEAQETFGRWPRDVGPVDVPITMDPGMHAWEPGEAPVRVAHARAGYAGLQLIDLAAGTAQVVSSPGNQVDAVLGWAPSP